MRPTRVVFCAVDRTMAEAWWSVMDESPVDFDSLGLEVRHASLFDVPADAIVSPANSFGYMDGGLDLLINDRYGVQDRVQRQIGREHAGELPVGSAIMVDLEKPCRPCGGKGAGTDPNPHPIAIPAGRTCRWCTGIGERHLVVAPTMRVPCRPTVPLASYLATRAAILLATRRAVNVLAVPGMGTGSAVVPYKIAARQMVVAWASLRLPTTPPHWNPHLLRQHDGLLGGRGSL